MLNGLLYLVKLNCIAIHYILVTHGLEPQTIAILQY